MTSVDIQTKKEANHVTRAYGKEEEGSPVTTSGRPDLLVGGKRKNPDPADSWTEEGGQT